MNLAGQTAVVTGGNRGIGLAAVQALSQAGARVTFTARSDAAVSEAMSGLDGDVRGVVVDVTDRGRMADLLSADVDILVNNAGVIEPIGLMAETDMASWDRCIEVNLLAAVHAMRSVIPGMASRGRGTIVNLSSGAARKPMEGWSAYCASKAALAMVGQCVSGEYGGAGIRVFGFAPGLVDTGMQGKIRSSGINPVSRLTRSDLSPPSEAGHAIAWLCTSAADAYAGQEVDIRDTAFRRAAGLAVAS